MVTTYNDDMNEYYLTEFIRGVELFDAIRDIGEPQLQFINFFRIIKLGIS